MIPSIPQLYNIHEIDTNTMNYETRIVIVAQIKRK